MHTSKPGGWLNMVGIEMNGLPARVITKEGLEISELLKEK